MAKAIKRSGLSRAELARRLGVSASSITLWAQGRRRMLEPVALALADLIGVKRSTIKIKTREVFLCLREETGTRRRA